MNPKNFCKRGSGQSVPNRKSRDTSLNSGHQIGTDCSFFLTLSRDVSNRGFMSFCRQLLTKEFNNRRLRNSAYSLRAFSRDLGIGVTSLSDFFASKRDLSKSSIARVVDSLKLSEEEKQLIANERKRSLTPQESLKILIEEDQFRMISDWYYLAVLNLARIKSNRADPEWIAKRLGIETSQAREAVERLKRMKFLKVEGKRMIRTTQTLATRTDIPSSAIKKHNTDILRLAERSIYNDPVEAREISSSTIAINPEKLPKAKEILTRTKLRLTELLMDDSPSEVYALSFQLFPLSKKGVEP